MAGEVEFRQIYYDPEQLPLLFPFAKPYFNPTLTVFFENSVIVDVVRASNAQKVGVCSYKLYGKIGNGIPMRGQFEEKHLYTDYDVLALGRRQPDHRMLYLLDKWHPGAREILELIFKKIGFTITVEPKHAIYSNHFMARTDIYQEYVETMLSPAMELMENDPEVRPRAYEDSNYFRLVPNSSFERRVREHLGLNYLPLHTFLCERMFSCFINGKKLDVKYLPEIV